MKIYEIGTGYSSIPTKVGAATEIVIAELANVFQVKRQNVTIIDIADKNRLNNDFNIIEVKIPVFLDRITYSLGILHYIKRVVYSIKLALTLNKQQIDEGSILHFHNQYNYFFFELLCSSIRNKVKTMYTIHSHVWSQNWDNIKSNLKKKYFMEIFSLKKCDYIVALNEKGMTNLIDNVKIPKGKFHLIPNGVNNKAYYPIKDKEYIASLKKKMGIKNQKVIFHVGSVCERKNQLGIIKELTSLIKDHKIVFMYAGGIIDQSYQDNIRRYADENGIRENIFYLGEISPGYELNRYYNLADAFVFLSTSEAFSLVIIEALSSGLTVFLSDYYKNHFFAPFEGEGLVFMDGKNLAEIVWDNMKDSTKMIKLSKAAFLTSNNFSWANVGESYLKIMNESVRSKEVN